MLRAFRLLLVTFWPTLSSRLRRGPLRPSWPFLFEWLVRHVRRDWDETASWPLPRQRANFARKFYPKPHVRQVQVRPGVIAGVRVRHFIPPVPGTTRIVYFHGGSYVYGSTDTSHAELCAHLALATSLEVVGVEYRLAPESPWPAQLEYAVGVCRELTGSPLVLAGDSAGGHLAVKTAQQMKVEALALISPWVDLEMRGHEYLETYDIGTCEVLRRQALAVAGALPVASLSLSKDPLGALPPTLVVAGGAEALLDDITGFAGNLRADGVDCTLHVAEDMPHCPPLFEAFHPSARHSFDAVADFVRSHAKGPASL